MPQIGYAAAVPTDTTQFYSAGDIVINNATGVGPVSGGAQPFGWVCIAQGYPGTWAVIQFDYSSPAVSSTLTAGQLPGGSRFILWNPGAGFTMTLPTAASYAPGALLSIKNLSATTATLVAASTDNYEGGIALTLAQNVVASMLRSPTASTQWYKAL